MASRDAADSGHALRVAANEHVRRLLGLAEPSHAHVPLVLGSDGARLAKRHGTRRVRA